MKTTKRSARLLVFVAVVAAYVFGTATSASAATFEGLGDLPGGDVGSRAFGISADGTTVVGRSAVYFYGPPYSESFYERAFIWDAQIGIRTLGVDALYQDAFAVSADGSRVAGIGLDAPRLNGAYLWDDLHGSQNLGGLPGLASGALGMSPDAAYVVGWSRNIDPFGMAFRWDGANGMVHLGTLAGAQYGTQANGVSADGSIVVGNATTSEIAFIWDAANGMRPLFPGQTSSSSALAISSDGTTIVGYRTISGPGQKAFRWTETAGLQYLRDPTITANSQALAVSADGATIVGWARSVTGPPTTDAFVWSEGTGMQTVSSRLSAQGVDLTGWTLSRATAVSADGTTIAGSGLNPNGRAEAWIAVLPEPGLAVLLASGIVALVGHARSRAARSRTGK